MSANLGHYQLFQLLSPTNFRQSHPFFIFSLQPRKDNLDKLGLRRASTVKMDLDILDIPAPPVTVS